MNDFLKMIKSKEKESKKNHESISDESIYFASECGLEPSKRLEILLRAACSLASVPMDMGEESFIRVCQSTRFQNHMTARFSKIPESTRRLHTYAMKKLKLEFPIIVCKDCYHFFMSGKEEGAVEEKDHFTFSEFAEKLESEAQADELVSILTKAAQDDIIDNVALELEDVDIHINTLVFHTLKVKNALHDPTLASWAHGHVKTKLAIIGMELNALCKSAFYVDMTGVSEGLSTQALAHTLRHLGDNNNSRVDGKTLTVRGKGVKKDTKIDLGVLCECVLSRKQGKEQTSEEI
jgi:hypothetical protein